MGRNSIFIFSLDITLSKWYIFLVNQRRFPNRGKPPFLIKVAIAVESLLAFSPRMSVLRSLRYIHKEHSPACICSPAMQRGTNLSMTYQPEKAQFELRFFYASKSIFKIFMKFHSTPLLFFIKNTKMRKHYKEVLIYGQFKRYKTITRVRK